MITEELLKKNGFKQKLNTYVRDFDLNIAIMICGFPNSDIWAVHILNHCYEGFDRVETRKCKLTMIKTHEQLLNVLKIFGINTLKQ